MSFLTHIQEVFELHANTENATAMQAYMKDRFSFYGIKAPDRKRLLKEVHAEHKEEVDGNIRTLTDHLYQLEARELHYCAMELYQKCLKKKYLETDVSQIEKLITTHSWWDTVDFIAKHILGYYLLLFPNEINSVITSYSKAENMWLNRSAILFQLAYKNKTDASLLFDLCIQHKDSNEFFIQKAIGWALREYSKVNPEEVVSFVSKTKLKPLSEREALKRIHA